VAVDVDGVPVQLRVHPFARAPWGKEGKIEEPDIEKNEKEKKNRMLPKKKQKHRTEGRY